MWIWLDLLEFIDVFKAKIAIKIEPKATTIFTHSVILNDRVLIYGIPVFEVTERVLGILNAK